MGSLTKPRVLLLGLDGATFSLLDALAARGLMPGYRRWKAQGASGSLESTNPPTTPAAWSSCVTGMNPGQHGVFDFRESFHQDRRRPLIRGDSIRAPRIWDVLAASGRRSCILNFPLIWPPEQIDGVMVCGMMAPEGTAQLSWPADEAERLRREVPGYRSNVDIPGFDVEFLSGALGFMDELERSLRSRIAAFWHYFDREPWDFFFPTFVFHDRMGHLLWKFMSGESDFDEHPFADELRPRIEAVYAAFDELLEELLERRSTDLTLMMCSDHGFGGTESFFEVNAWLQELGVLRLGRRARLRSEAFYRAMEFGDHKALQRAVPDSLQARLRSRLRSRRSSFMDALSDTVQWSKTEAFFASVPQQGITLVRQPGKAGEAGCSKSDYEDLRRRIKNGLVELRAADGSPLIDEVWDREQLYSGPHVDLAPDILFRARDYACVGRPVLGARHWLKDNSSQASGFHRMDGVWMALGEGIDAATRVEGARIEDVCPSVLYALGEAIPEGLDGRVLEQSWSDGFLEARPRRTALQTHRRPIGSSYADAAAAVRPSSDDLSNRLSALGYMDLV
jgi:predicted AlkP superfamily phosphohydrolase/phosphomutase